MPNPKLKKTDIIIITILFILYIVGYACLIEPKKDAVREKEKPAVQVKQETGQTKIEEKRQVKKIKLRSIDSQFDEASYYQDHYDEYLDDPEDEIRFPPEIFDANKD